jgi:aspartate-semialdehyde dehydrogenase
LQQQGGSVAISFGGKNNQELAVGCTDPAKLEAAFATAGMKVAKKGDGPPDNVIAAGESEIQIGLVDRDPSIANGCWMWGVADNLRLAATNAVRIAEELLVIPA